MIRRPPRSTLFPTRRSSDRSYSESLTRSYKDKSDQWQRTSSLDEEDLLPAAKALDDAYTWIQRQRHPLREGTLHDLHTPLRARSEEHTSELQSRQYLVCRLL